MLEYAPMLHVSYCAQNYAGIIRQGLAVGEQSAVNLLNMKPFLDCVHQV